MPDHSNTYAVITGGSQGLGLAVAECLAKEGAKGIILAARSRDKGELAAAHITALGTTCFFVEADMAKPADCHKAVDSAIEHFGHINVLVNSAATTERGSLLDTSLEIWQKHMDINLRGPFLTMQRAVGHMKQQASHGSIVNIISMVAHCGQSYLTAYSASKGGLSTLTKNVANAFVGDHIRCNGVLTGWMDTPGEDATQKAYHGAGEDWLGKAEEDQPMGQLVKPHQLAGLVSYMASPDSGVMTGALVDYDQRIVGAYPE